MDHTSSIMISPWQVEFLGGLRIHREGMPPLCRLRTAKTTALLAFLCAHIDRDQGREELIELFWPDLPFDAGRNSLRIALSALRRALHSPEMNVTPEAILHATRSQVRLCAGFVETDVAALEAALQNGDLSRAATIAAKGPFLPGIQDEWVFGERERVEALREQALEEAPEAAIMPPLPSYILPGSVPVPLGRFYGRESERARLLALLVDPAARLVTITGMGGMGKTRLAVETARSLRESAYSLSGRSVGGVWFVPLVSATRGGHLLPSICQVVGSAFTGEGDALETLAAHLRATSGRTFLILDNLEQIEPDECAVVLLRLLERIPSVVCLTTSRRRIGLPGERVLALSPFSVPESSAPLVVLANHPAVALFVDRAREADVDFVLTPNRAPQIIDLCTRLNGVPLALEMAASWAGIYTPGDMAAKVAGSGDSLSGRHAGRESRHRSLRAVATWSIQLLPTEARSMLAALSVFQGRWTGDAAKCVIQEVYSEERLALLCDHSLVTGATEESSASLTPYRHFQIAPALRSFARELLSGAQEEEAVRYAHARHFTEAAVARETNPETLVDTLAALEFWEADPRRLSEALRLVGALFGYWWCFGQWDEAQAVAHRVLARVPDDAGPDDISQDALSDALRCAGKLAFYRRDFDAAREYANRRLILETRRGRLAETIHLRANFATLDMEEGRYEEARIVFEALLPLLPTIGSDWEMACAYIYSNYADTLLSLGQTEAARTATEVHLQDMECRGRHRTGIAGLNWARLATIHRMEGRGNEARACAEEALGIFRECGEIFRIADVLLQLSGIAREARDMSGALVALRESFALRRRTPSTDGFLRSIDEAERLLAESSQPVEIAVTRSVREAFERLEVRLENWNTSLK